jgi:hypothetical protein
MLFLRTILAAEEFNDIAPPVDYSLIPRWAIVATVLAGIALVALVTWWITKRYQRSVPPPPLPRDRALAALRNAEPDVERLTPYEFSIRVSDILRGYVSEQFGLPLTRQTSFEFLEHLKHTETFSDDEKQLLEAFLNRCDMIKFAKYEASQEDSRLLLEEAEQFVKGEKVAYAPA